MKKLIFVLITFSLSTTLFASDTIYSDLNDFENRVSRLESQVRELERDVRNQSWKIRDLENRVRRLEWKSSSGELQDGQ